MNREQVIAALREHEPELKAAGVAHLALHGSYAREAAVSGQSDVDVIVGVDPSRKLSLIGRIHLENRLWDILGIRAGLATGQCCFRRCSKKHIASRFLFFEISPQRLFADIADAIAMIEQFTVGMIGRLSLESYGSCSG